MHALLTDVTGTAPLTHLTVDSTSLRALSTSVKEPEERYNKFDLALIREAYDSGRLNVVFWCPDMNLLADPLTKDNRATAALLLTVLSSGVHIRPSEMTANVGQKLPSPTL